MLESSAAIISDYNNHRGIKVETIKTKHGIDGSVLYSILDLNNVPRRVGKFFAPHVLVKHHMTPQKFGTIKTASKENVNVGDRMSDGGLVLKKTVLKKDTIFEYTINYGMYKKLEDAHV